MSTNFGKSFGSITESLVNDSEIRARLLGIIQGLPAPRDWREDMMQEALAHLCLIQKTRPDEEVSWKLQSCWFHLQHFLRQQHSLDVLKSYSVCAAAQRHPDWDQLDDFAESATQESVFAEVCGREEMALLRKVLTPLQQSILQDLVDEFYGAEIAVRHGLSAQSVSKHLKQIEKLALEIGMPRPKEHSRI